MNRHNNCGCCEDNSGGFFLGLIIGLMIGAIIAILIYRHNKSEVIQVLKRKINRFVSNIENNIESIKPVKKTSTKTTRIKIKKPHPKTFLVK
jgi:gas vesicle protein